MTHSERPFKEKLALQIVRLKIRQLFEDCSKFEERDKKALYEEIGNLLLQRIRSAETPALADEAPPRISGLTDATLSDDFTKSSRHCTIASSKMSRLPMVDVNVAFPRWPRRAGIRRQWGLSTWTGIAMRQSEFDKIIAALRRAEFAVEELGKRAEELKRKSAAAKSVGEIAAVNLEAAELLQQIVKINTAVHTGNPAPHLRLVSDTE
jgi:hypothetical protein